MSKNPVGKAGIEKSKFSAIASGHNLKSPISANSPRTNNVDMISTGKTQNLMSIIKILGEKKTSPSVMKPELTQMSGVLQQLTSMKTHPQQKTAFNYNSILNNKSN